jgi:uncharacterized phage-associated protein
MATSTEDRVAEALINLSHDKKDPISNLKLQKLLYYSQAWYLAFFKKPLFDEEIQAWVHGPVVPRVFSRYRVCRWSPIPAGDTVGVSEQVGRHIEEIWKAYGKFSAYELERLTHSEKPWKDARGNLPPDASSHNVITKDVMMSYYSSRLNG